MERFAWFMFCLALMAIPFIGWMPMVAWSLNLACDIRDWFQNEVRAYRKLKAMR